MLAPLQTDALAHTPRYPLADAAPSHPGGTRELPIAWNCLECSYRRFLPNRHVLLFSFQSIRQVGAYSLSIPVPSIATPHHGVLFRGLIYIRTGQVREHHVELPLEQLTESLLQIAARSWS
jgi:hypothetical protein